MFGVSAVIRPLLRKTENWKEMSLKEGVLGKNVRWSDHIRGLVYGMVIKSSECY